MANSPDVDGRYFLPATAPISGGIEKSTVVDRRHGIDTRPPVAQRAPSGLERPHMHANFIKPRARAGARTRIVPPFRANEKEIWVQ